MRYGHAEDRHDRVADELLDAAFMSRDDARGTSEDARHDLAHLLGVEPLGRCGEAAHVGEQHGDVLAFGTRGLDRLQRRAALVAKAGIGGVCGSTAGAGEGGVRCHRGIYSQPRRLRGRSRTLALTRCGPVESLPDFPRTAFGEQVELTVVSMTDRLGRSALAAPPDRSLATKGICFRERLELAGSLNSEP